MTDYFPSKDGYVADGDVVGFCYADGAIVAGTYVAFGTSRANYVAVATTSTASAAIGMALRDASAAGDIIPVCFMGVVKTIAGAAIATGALVGNSATSNKVVTLAYTSDKIRINGIGGNYTARILGTCLQGAHNNTDECLVYIGKTF